ncbi:tail protein [Achromobacter piechaudii]|uniref:phage tail protein n=1 Tax=Achromobacter piechaudii TaxID=72556 RepID=UPI0006A4ED75|nr:phage tail protein [Achromobacter piechaudii]KNY05619.1 tail protein [Achromobacter piechaudii]
MRKANELREYLTRHNRFLNEFPDRLHVFVEQGNIHCSATRSLSHEYRFTLTIVVTDYAGSTDALMLPLLAWIRVKQPELMANKDRRENGISFEVELLDNNAADVEIKIPLTERVIVQSAGDGNGMIAVHEDEPADEDLPLDAEEITVELPGFDPVTISVPAWPHPYE